MTVGEFVWNATEYLAYLCIIIQTGLNVLQFIGISNMNVINGDGGISQLLSTFNRVASQFVQEPPKKKR